MIRKKVGIAKPNNSKGDLEKGAVDQRSAGKTSLTHQRKKSDLTSERKVRNEGEGGRTTTQKKESSAGKENAGSTQPEPVKTERAGGQSRILRGGGEKRRAQRPSSEKGEG